MSNVAALSLSQYIVWIGLYLFAAIVIFGGSLQMYLGEPDTFPRLDDVHRFMAGVYLGTGLICFWAGLQCGNKVFSFNCSLSVCCSQALAGLSPSASSVCQSPQ